MLLIEIRVLQLAASTSLTMYKFGALRIFLGVVANFLAGRFRVCPISLQSLLFKTFFMPLSVALVFGKPAGVVVQTVSR